MTINKFLNCPIIEVAYVDMIRYSDGSGCFHLEVNLLVDSHGSELVVQLSGSPDQMVPYVELDFWIRIMDEGSSHIVGKLQFRDLYDMGAIRNHIDEGNNKEDLVDLFIEHMSPEEFLAVAKTVEEEGMA